MSVFDPQALGCVWVRRSEHGQALRIAVVGQIGEFHAEGERVGCDGRVVVRRRLFRAPGERLDGCHDPLRYAVRQEVHGRHRTVLQDVVQPCGRDGMQVVGDAPGDPGGVLGIRHTGFVGLAVVGGPGDAFGERDKVVHVDSLPPAEHLTLPRRIGGASDNGTMTPASIFRDPRVEGLIERGRRRSRLSLATRIDRVRSKAWHIAQCAVAAGVAWAIAHDLLGHAAPFFAPIVAVICLGMTYEQRLRRVAEVTVGVALGVAIADAFVGLAGTGAWQISVVVLAAMTVALLLDAGLLLVMQAAVQSIVVTVLVPAPGQAFVRWWDAVIGGAVALVFAAVVPSAPLRRPRHQAARVARRIAVLLRDAAVSAQDGDVDRAAEVLSRARETDELIRELQGAADEGMSVIASSPFRRSDGHSVRTMASVVEPLDRALRSTRVLVRRVSIAAYHHADIPPAFPEVWDDLADAVDILARAWSENRSAEFARPALQGVGDRCAALTPGEYHTTVLLAQTRMLVVDLLELSGLEHEDAATTFPPEA